MADYGTKKILPYEWEILIVIIIIVSLCLGIDSLIHLKVTESTSLQE